MSNLDLCSCSVTYCETSYTLCLSFIGKTKVFHSFLTYQVVSTKTDESHALLKILKEHLQPNMVLLLPSLFRWRLIHMDYIDWGCALKRTSKNKPRGTIAPCAWTPWCQTTRWPFSSTFRMLTVLRLPAFPFPCRPLPSLSPLLLLSSISNRWQRICSLVLSDQVPSAP